jgi:hypothetical protein
MSIVHKKENIYYIGNSRYDFIRRLKARNATSHSYEGFFVFKIFGPSMVGRLWESLELGKGFLFLFF